MSTSSLEQQNSYQNQIRNYELAIKTNCDYDFSGIYADEGKSGTSLKRRTEFNRMMQDCRDGKIDLILTKSVSRFGRNVVDCLNSIRELKAIGVEVHFEKENIFSLRSEGELLLSVMSAVAENESLNLSENVKWGHRRRAEQGRTESIPSGHLYGFTKTRNGCLEIVEHEAVVVRRVYQMYLDGFGYYQIADKLNIDGVGTVWNKKWTGTGISKMLKNEKYKGDVRTSKSYSADHLTGRKVINRGEVPSLYYENTHPAIVDRDIWDCVQLEHQRQIDYCQKYGIIGLNNHTEQFPLAGRVICAECGGAYRIRGWCQKNNQVWRCVNNLPERGTCKNGVKLPLNLPEKVFVAAWNQLVRERDQYESDWQQTMDGGDLLQRYRAKDLLRLIDEVGVVEAMPYELMLKVLDHIEVEKVGSDHNFHVILASALQTMTHQIHSGK